MANQIIAGQMPVVLEDGTPNVNKSNYMDAFHSENWERLNFDSRVSALQHLENQSASEQGRSARTIEPSFFEKDENGFTTVGYYSPEEQDKLFINQDAINSNSPYQAMSTVLHEGRHAYQDDIVNDRTSTDKNMDPADAQLVDQNKDVWEKNMQDDVYFSPKEGDSFSEYRYQPIEADANNYSDAKMAEFGEKFGDDFNYLEWQNIRQGKNSQNCEDAKRELNCENPEECMKERVLEKSEALDKQEQSSHSDGTDPSNHLNDMPQPQTKTSGMEKSQSSTTSSESNKSQDTGKSDGYDYDYGYGY